MMSEKDDEPGTAAELRRRAEELAREKDSLLSADLETLSPDQIRQMIHELRVHQIELQMQNGQLRRAEEELETVRERYFDLYNLAPVGYFVVSLEGLILEVNLTGSTLLDLPRAVLIKKPISRFIFKADQEVYYRHRQQLHVTGKPHACELRMVKSDGTVFWVLLTATSAQEPPTTPGQETEGATVSRVVLSDITDRKRVEEEKAELEVQLRQAKEHNAAGLNAGEDQGEKRTGR